MLSSCGRNVHARAKEYDAAHCLYDEALVLRTRMNTWIDIFWVRTAMAQLALDQDCADEAKLHLDDALALMPVVDFQQNGLFLIALTAEWAALVGQHEVAVFLDAACKEQHARAGQPIHGPRQVERFEHARLALNADTREQLLSAGHGLGYEQVLESVHAFLTGGQAAYVPKANS